MASDETHGRELEAAGATAGRAALVNLAIGAAAMAYGLVAGANFMIGLAAGFLIGAVNMSWLLRILRRGINLDSQKAARSVARGYYVRFMATIIVFYVVISRGWFNPWQLIIGFSLSVFSIIVIIIVVASGIINPRAGPDRTLKNESKQEG